MVRENLALAIACWTAVQKGQITPAQLPAGREALVGSAGQVAGVFNPLPPMNRAELARCSSNQVRCAFAFSAMQAHRTLEAVCPGAPLTQQDDALSAARACLYLLDRTFRRGMLVPVWSCPPEYRRSFTVAPASFVLDTTNLDGKPVSWDDFGGLEKYLRLLDFCAAAVEGLDRLPDSPADFAEEAFSGHGNGAGTVEDAGKPATANAEDAAPEADSADEMVRGFVDDRCVVGQGTRIIARGLYDEFLDWCMETEREPLSQRAFGMRLTGMGFRRKRRGRGRHWWEGLGLKDSGG